MAVAMKERNHSAETAIRNAMFRNNVTAKDIEKHKIMCESTFYKKRLTPRLFTLEDFWKLNELLHFNQYEMELILGRRF